jgi:hypothetical protein
MALVKHNNNSISAVTSMASLSTGSMTLISEQTASSSASISFTTGIDSTYPIYKFEFIDIHPASQATFTFNMSSDGGSNYNVTKTTTAFRSLHNENDAATDLSYQDGNDLAQSTGYQPLSDLKNNDNDSCIAGYLHLFNPSSTTFVKHYLSNTNCMQRDSRSVQWHSAGYGNTTNAIDAIDFKFSSGNIDAGTIKLYGIKDS